MRTLKKSLCLVLALVMVLGLFVMGANAEYTPYGDEATITYLDAVQVLTGLGVIEGRTDGNFDPKATVTRAEACAMITRMMLGREAADKLPVGDVKFSDVSLDSWEGRMAKYIAFCANRGIVVGMGDGTFHPTEPVTGTQLATMLLRALGYGAMGEYEGKGWDINAVADALYYKIFDDTEVTDFSAPATREETALYVFNTLWVQLVAYDVDIDHYVYRLGTFASEVFDLERIEKAQVMANQATGDTYTVIRVWNEDTDSYDGDSEIIYLDYESGLGLIAHEVTVYRNIDKSYRDKDNTRYWKTYLLQDQSTTVRYANCAVAFKGLRDANRTNLEAPWNDMTTVQYWNNYVYLDNRGIRLTDRNGEAIDTINKLKGWETVDGFTVVLDSEGHLLARLATTYTVDQVKKIVDDEIYLRVNNYAEEWETYDLALAYEGIAKGDYVTVQPVGKLCYLYPTSTAEIDVFERSFYADYHMSFFNNFAVRPSSGYLNVIPPDTVPAENVAAGDKVLFYMDYYGAYFAAQILERGTLDGVVYIVCAFTKTGEDDYGDPDDTISIQCVNEKGEEKIYKLDKDQYKDLDVVKDTYVGDVWRVFLDKKGFARLSKGTGLGTLQKEKGKTQYLTNDGDTYYVTKDTKIYYVNGEKSKLEVTKAKTLPASEEYDEVFAMYSSNGSTYNTSVLWIINENAPKSSDSYIYVADIDGFNPYDNRLEDTGTMVVNGEKTYYFNVYVDGVIPMDKKIFVENEDLIFEGDHAYLQCGFYVYNVDSNGVYDLEKVEDGDNPVVAVRDTITLEGGAVKDGKWYYEADGEKVELKVVMIDDMLSNSLKRCLSYDKKRYVKFADLEDISDFLADEKGNNVTVSYLASKVNDNYIPFGTIYVISCQETDPDDVK